MNRPSHHRFRYRYFFNPPSAAKTALYRVNKMIDPLRVDVHLAKRRFSPLARFIDGPGIAMGADRESALTWSDAALDAVDLGPVLEHGRSL